MSKKPESVFYTSVHKHLPPKLYRMKTNNPYEGGIWDVWYSGKKKDLWVEYKFVVLPVRGSTMVDVTLSELQKDWGRDRVTEGRNLAVIVGCKEGGVILENFDWGAPYSRDVFVSKLRSRAEIAQWITDYTGGPP